MTSNTQAKNQDIPLLEVRDLSCERADRELFRDLCLSLAPGELMQIEGANGAGKTSLIRILCGFLTAKSGAVYFRGTNIFENPLEFQEEILYIGHQHAIKAQLTVAENLDFYSQLSPREGVYSLETAIAEVGLAGYEDVFCSDLSAGQRRRVALARLLVTNAALWILDEPFVALDKKAVLWLEQLILAHVERGGSALFTSHQAFISDFPVKVLRL